MEASAWKPEHTARAQEIWQAYEREHDLSHLRGKIAAIDPESGRVWIGDSGVDAAHRVRADGVDTPVWFVRVGYDYFVVKGRR